MKKIKNRNAKIGKKGKYQIEQQVLVLVNPRFFEIFNNNVPSRCYTFINDAKKIQAR